MASYGTFIAACGFEYHAVKAHIGFSPKITPEDFRAAFTAADGWGTFSQKKTADVQKAEIDLKYGTLTLQKVTLDTGLVVPKTVGVRFNKSLKQATIAVTGSRVVVLLAEQVTLKAGEKLTIWLGV